jgi:carbamoyl-phosphate synthase large subunit
MGIDRDFATAYLKAQLGAGIRLPVSGSVLLSVRDADKPGVEEVARRLVGVGFHLLATRGTAEFLRRFDVPVETVAKVEEGSPHVLDLLDQGEVQLLIETSLWADEVRSGRPLRTRALQRRIPYCSRLSIARAMVDAIDRQRDWNADVRSLQSYAQPRRPLKLFIRQPLTQSGDESKKIVEGVLRIVDEIGRNGTPFEYLTGNTPLSDQTFREAFERSQGLPFSPQNFRRYRLSQLRRADAFLYVRTAMSESGAFEICYNVYNEPQAPMFFAVWRGAPIRTTLLRELADVCDVTYREFEDPEELRIDLQSFFDRVAESATAASDAEDLRDELNQARVAFSSRRGLLGFDRHEAA